MGKKSKRPKATNPKATNPVVGRGAVELSVVAWCDLPIIEASGLGVWRAGDVARVVAIGDHDATIAVGTADAVHAFTWEVTELGPALGADALDQFEAIDTDSAETVVLLTEDPPVAFVVDAQRRTLVARIALDAAQGAGAVGGWHDASSRGEGLLLLRDGHLLVIKEKRPSALVEMGPAGAQPVGLHAVLAAGDVWVRPLADTTFVALATWTLKGDAAAAMDDISDAAIGRDGRILLLSDQSRRIAAVPADLAVIGGVVEEFAETWDLPKELTKPEGLVVLADGHALVCLDQRQQTANAAVLAPVLG